MSRKLIHSTPDEAGQLRCDAVDCDFVEPSPQAFTAELIGKPCPKCGANLLTERGYADTRRMLRAIDLINRLFGWLGSDTPRSEHHSVQIRSHADEVTTI